MVAVTRQAEDRHPLTPVPAPAPRSVYCPACDATGHITVFLPSAGRLETSPPEQSVPCPACNGDRYFELGRLRVLPTEYSDVWYAEGDEDAIRALVAYLGEGWSVDEDGELTAPTRLTETETVRVLRETVAYLRGTLEVGR